MARLVRFPPSIASCALVLAFGCSGGGRLTRDAGHDPDAGRDDAAVGAHIFVTSADFDGAFGEPEADGTVMADQQCQTAAAGAGLDGTWTAWLSRLNYGNVPARTAPERVTGQGPWYLTGTDELVFLNRSALANTPRVPIDHNELGVKVPAGAVWTGTLVGGGFGNADCQGWTNGNSAYNGVVGELDATTSAWTDTGNPQKCNVRAHLYCLEN